MDARSHGRPAARPALPNAPASAPAAVAAGAAGSGISLQEAIGLLSSELLTAGRELAFSVDEVTGKTVLRVVHAGTGEVIRQIPNETVLAVAARLRAGESMNSLGIDAWV